MSADGPEDVSTPGDGIPISGHSEASLSVLTALKTQIEAFHTVHRPEMDRLAEAVAGISAALAGPDQFRNSQNTDLSFLSQRFSLGQTLGGSLAGFRAISATGLVDMTGMQSAMSGLSEQIEKFVGVGSAQFRELSNSITFLMAKLGHELATSWFRPQPIQPLWIDLFEARRGNTEAAGRLAARINWRPSWWEQEAILLRARKDGGPRQEVIRQALTHGLLMALGWRGNEEVPVLLESESRWVYDGEKPLTFCPGTFTVSHYWEWVQEEAVRAARLWLCEHPYAPALVLAEPLGPEGEIRLARFTSLTSADGLQGIYRGRPLGSGVFENCEAFVREVRLSIDCVRSRGQNVTQERVAAILSERGLLGTENPERQLRRWTRQFGFDGWLHLLRRI